MKPSIIHLATLALVLLLGTHAAPAENRVALVIGQSAYRAVPPLPNPANDAKMMIELLTAAGFEVTAAPDVSQSDMRKAIGDFADKLNSKGPDTVALVYYAGHGLQVDGENFPAAGRRHSPARSRHPAAGRAAQRPAEFTRRGAEQDAHHHARFLS